MKKKILTICLIVALAATAIIGGTLAYFTDTKEVTNTFTVGNVSIELIESQYHRVNAGKGDVGDVEEPLQGGYLWASNVTLEGNTENTPNYVTSKEVWSGKYFSDDQIEADAATYKNGYFAEHNNMMPGSNVRKNPYVKNTGANDAYIRVRVLIPVSLFTVIDNGPSYWTTTAMNEGEVTSKAVAYYLANGYTPDPSTIVTRDDNIEYYEFDFTYTDAVKPGELTFWNVWGN
ncbi:MAG: SipW-dependent-type signal peptide-containing protein, partial [Christensenellales bacterium]